MVYPIQVKSLCGYLLSTFKTLYKPWQIFPAYIPSFFLSILVLAAFDGVLFMLGYPGLFGTATKADWPHRAEAQLGGHVER